MRYGGGIMLIKNFGHHWERKYINFGRGKVKGHLRGYHYSQQADFREQIGVYVLYDRNYTPVYVGQAGNGNARLWDRLNQHTSDHLWNRWESFSWFGIKRVNANGTLSDYDKVSKIFKSDGRGLLNEFEAILIEVIEPRSNKQGAKWKDCTEYYQEIDESMDDVTNDDIMVVVKEVKSTLLKMEKKLK